MFWCCVIADDKAQYSVSVCERRWSDIGVSTFEDNLSLKKNSNLKPNLRKDSFKQKIFCVLSTRKAFVTSGVYFIQSCVV